MKLIKIALLAVTAASLAIFSSCSSNEPAPAPSQPTYIAPTK